MPTDQEWADFQETNAREHGELRGRIDTLEANVDGGIRLTWALFLLVLALLGSVLASPFLDRWYG